MAEPWICPVCNRGISGEQKTCNHEDAHRLPYPVYPYPAYPSPWAPAPYWTWPIVTCAAGSTGQKEPQ